MLKKSLYLFLLFICFGSTLKSQADYNALCNSVLNLKTFEKQQDRHIYINDSIEKLSQYKNEFDYLSLVYKRCIATGNKKLQGTVLISLGNFQISCGNYSASLDTFNIAITVFKELKDFGGQSTVHANMGNAYFYLQDLEKALDYYKLAVSDLKKSSMSKENADNRLATCYNSLGSIYSMKGDFVFGKTYFDLAYNLWRNNKDSLSMAYIYNNYAEMFVNSNQIDSAFYYFKMAMQIKERHGDAYDKADAYNNMANCYLQIKKPAESVNFALKSLHELDTTIYSRTLIMAYSILTESYNALKDYRNELKYYKKYKAAMDSSDVQGQNSELGRKELQNEFDRIHLSDSIKAVEEIKLKDAKLSEKKQQTYFLIFILLLTVGALSLIYSRFKLTKKQKQIIEEKNKEITDSINYAKKIQQSILPTEKYFGKEINRLRDKK